LPQDILARLREVRSRNTERNGRILHQLRELCTLLRADGIPTLVSKGLPLAHRYYDDIGLRVLYDLDLLIRGKDRAAALATLDRAGYVSYFAQHSVPGPKILLWRPTEYAWDAEGIFDPERPVLVELHTAPWEEAWHGFRLPCPFDITSDLRIDDPPDSCLGTLPDGKLIVQLAVHYACNALESNARLMHLLDVGLILRRCGHTLDWEEVLHFIEAGSLHGFCFLTLDLARRACGVEIPARIDQALRKRTPAGILNWLDCKGLASAAAMSMYDPDHSTIHYLHWHMAGNWIDLSHVLAFALSSAWNEERGLRRLPAFLRRNASRVSEVLRAFAVK
jgi:hypothetical protein